MLIISDISNIRGRMEYNYLPYPLDNVISPCAYREDDSTEQYDFYQAHFELGENDPYAYSRTVYESSPLNRVLEQEAQGNYCQPDDFSLHTTGLAISKTNPEFSVAILQQPT